MNVRLLLVLLTLATPVVTQAAAQPAGFAGLGADAAGFALPERRPLVFPRDHGPHERFRIEWWYLTATLKDALGRRYGAQWTLFRSALSPTGADLGWSSPQLWMAHAAVTTPDAHFSAQRLARGGIGQAGVTAQPFAAWIDEWAMTAQGDGLDALTLTARGEGFSYALEARAQGPLVAHGEGGYSVKGPGGQASLYYSQPFYRISGTLTLPSGPVAVTGEGWLDREWSSQPLDRTQTGWDWIALHLDDGRKLMAARLRGAAPYQFGSLIEKDGATRPLSGADLRLTPDGDEPPTTWRVEVPGAALDLTLAAVNRKAWMATTPPYWEGPVVVSGTVKGEGYLEMTGYPSPAR